MPLPVAPPLTATEAYAKSAQMAANIIAVVQRERAAASGSVRMPDLVALFDTLRDAKDTGELLAPTPGLEAYAQGIMGETYSITGWFQNVMLAGVEVTEWLILNLPNDGDGGIVMRRFVDGGMTEHATMSAQQLAPLLPLLDALISALQA